MKLVRRDNKCLRRNGKCFRDDEGVDCCCDGQLGACCYPYGSCIPDMTEEECQKNGGTWQGPGTTCEPNPCPIGCCLPNGTCVDMPFDQCTALGGSMNGPACTQPTCSNHCPPATPPHNCTGCPDIIVAYGYLQVKPVVCRPTLPACAGLPPIVTCEGEVTYPMPRVGCGWNLLQAQGIMTCDACQPPNPNTPRMNLAASVRCTTNAPSWPNPSFEVQGYVWSAGTSFVNCTSNPTIGECVHVCKGCEFSGGNPAIDLLVAYFPPFCPPPAAGLSGSYSWTGPHCRCQGFDCGCLGAGTCEWEGSVQVG